MTVDELEFYDEIDCGDLFVGNDLRERIMIFLLPWEIYDYKFVVVDRKSHPGALGSDSSKAYKVLWCMIQQI